MPFDVKWQCSNDVLFVFFFNVRLKEEFVDLRNPFHMLVKSFYHQLLTCCGM